MSRIAKQPVTIPKGVDVAIDDRDLRVKGPKGELGLAMHEWVTVVQEEGELRLAPVDGPAKADAMAGTMRALVANMVHGVSQGFEKRLALVGVGYRAQAQGKKLNLTLGFSHPVDFAVPDGITIETPSPTEIVITGVDKQQVGQVAAQIRALRPPEPYKGKGVRYKDERIAMKEAKKK